MSDEPGRPLLTPGLQEELRRWLGAEGYVKWQPDPPNWILRPPSLFDPLKGTYNNILCTEKSDGWDCSPRTEQAPDSGHAETGGAQAELAQTREMLAEAKQAGDPVGVMQFSSRQQQLDAEIAEKKRQAEHETGIGGYKCVDCGKTHDTPANWIRQDALGPFCVSCLIARDEAQSEPETYPVPTEPGWYWVESHEDDSGEEIVEVWRQPNGMLVIDRTGLPGFVENFKAWGPRILKRKREV